MWNKRKQTVLSDRPGRLVLIWLVIMGLDIATGGCLISRHGKISELEVRDSVTSSILVHDTLVQKDSSWVRDTLIGMSGGELTTVWHDTLIKQGPMRLLIRGNTVDCKWDSLTKVIRNLSGSLSSEYDLREINKSHRISSHEVKNTVQARQGKWYDGIIVFVKNILALAGLVWLIRLLITHYFKKLFL